MASRVPAVFGVAVPSVEGTVDEQALVAGIRRGDRKAFDAVFLAHYASMVRLAASYVRSVESAEELVQDLFFGVWERRTELQVSGCLSHYLLRAVRNRALNARRRHRIEDQFAITAGQELKTAPDAAQALEADELSRAIHQAIDALPERCRTAYTLHRQHGMTYAEIAEVMGIAPGTVMVQIGRALKALRIALADWVD